MKHLHSVLLLLLILLPAEVFSQIPRTISYQGILTDNTGSPKPDGTYSFTFKLYIAGSGGSALWTQTENLQVTKGLFITLLGAASPFNDSINFSKQYWLGIQIGTDPELSPRIKLSSSAYSLNSIRSDTARIAGTVADNSITGSKIVNGTIQFSDIGQNGATTGQVIKWNGSSWSAGNDSAGSGGGGGGNYWVQSGSKIYYNSGNVGVNNSDPSTLLDIGGGNNWDLTNGEGDFRIGNSSYRLKMGVALGGGGAGASTIMQHGQPGGYNVLSLGSQGNNILYLNGSNQAVGIGTNVPNAPLGFPPSVGKKITLYPGATGDVGFGVFGNELRINSDYSGADITFGYDSIGYGFTERMRVKGSGNVGIGTSNPNAPLGFPPFLGKKITLYPGATGDVGFGVAGNRLQIYSDNPNADVAIGYDAAGTFNERFAVKPNGALAVNGSTGTAGQVLQSNGSGSAAQWKSASSQWTTNSLDVYYSGGKVGIGGTPTIGDGVLDVGGRMRIQSGGGSISAGLWLNRLNNTATSAFIGMEDDSHVGFYGSTAGWKFSMNTQTGALKVNGSEGVAGQVLQSNGSGSAPQWQSIASQTKPYVLIYYQNAFFDLNGTGVTELPISGLNDNTFTLNQSSTIVFTGQIHPYADNGILGGNSFAKLLIEILDNSNNRVTFVNATAVVGNYKESICIGTGAGSLPAGNYKTRVRIMRDTDGEGRTKSNAGTNISPGELIIQVFPQ